MKGRKRKRGVVRNTSPYDAQIRGRTRIGQKTPGYVQMGKNPGAIDARAMSSGFATKEVRPRRLRPDPRPDFSNDFHPASREMKQGRRSTSSHPRQSDHESSGGAAAEVRRNRASRDQAR